MRDFVRRGNRTANRNNTLHFDQTDPHLSRHCTSGNTRMEVDRIFACSLKIAAIVSRRKIRTVQLFLFKFKSTRIRLRRNNYLYLYLKNRCQSRNNSLKFCRWPSRFCFFSMQIIGGYFVFKKWNLIFIYKIYFT